MFPMFPMISRVHMFINELLLMFPMISEDYAIKVSDIVVGYHINELRNVIRAKDDEINKQGSDILELKKMLQDFRLESGDKMNHIINQNEDLIEQNEDLTNTVEHNAEVLDEVASYMVPPPKKEHAIENVVIFRINPNVYKVTTCQTSTLIRSKNRIINARECS